MDALPPVYLQSPDPVVINEIVVTQGHNYDWARKTVPSKFVFQNYDENKDLYAMTGTLVGLGDLGYYPEDPDGKLLYIYVGKDRVGDAAYLKDLASRYVRVLKEAKKVATVYFGTDKFMVTEEDLDALKKLRTKVSLITSLEGYADQRGTNKYNLQLSRKRADAVAAYLREQGLEVEQVYYFGEQFSYVKDKKEMWRDRRVEIFAK